MSILLMGHLAVLALSIFDDFVKVAYRVGKGTFERNSLDLVFSFNIVGLALTLCDKPVYIVWDALAIIIMLLTAVWNLDGWLREKSFANRQRLDDEKRAKLIVLTPSSDQLPVLIEKKKNEGIGRDN